MNRNCRRSILHFQVKIGDLVRASATIDPNRPIFEPSGEKNQSIVIVWSRYSPFEPSGEKNLEYRDHRSRYSNHSNLRVRKTSNIAIVRSRYSNRSNLRVRKNLEYRGRTTIAIFNPFEPSGKNFWNIAVVLRSWYSEDNQTIDKMSLDDFARNFLGTSCHRRTRNSMFNINFLDSV